MPSSSGDGYGYGVTGGGYLEGGKHSVEEEGGCNSAGGGCGL